MLLLQKKKEIRVLIRKHQKVNIQSGVDKINFFTFIYKIFNIK
jgi:hypothetical protein